MQKKYISQKRWTQSFLEPSPRQNKCKTNKTGAVLRRTEMFLLIFGIEGHGTQLYFDICELSVGVASRLAPFLGSLRARTRLLPLLPLAVTPRLALRPRPFEGSTANLQTGQCLGFATKPHAWLTHARVHADSTVSQTYRQRSNRDRWGYECKWLQTIRKHYWPIQAYAF